MGINFGKIGRLLIGKPGTDEYKEIEVTDVTVTIVPKAPEVNLSIVGTTMEFVAPAAPIDFSALRKFSEEQTAGMAAGLPNMPKNSLAGLSIDELRIHVTETERKNVEEYARRYGRYPKGFEAGQNRNAQEARRGWTAGEKINAGDPVTIGAKGKSFKTASEVIAPHLRKLGEGYGMRYSRTSTELIFRDEDRTNPVTWRTPPVTLRCSYAKVGDFVEATISEMYEERVFNTFLSFFRGKVQMYRDPRTMNRIIRGDLDPDIAWEAEFEEIPDAKELKASTKELPEHL